MAAREGRKRPLLSVAGLSKSFPGQRALDDVSISLYPGEVHALLGTNGSGKSTLIKTLTGVTLPDLGATVAVGGQMSEFVRGAIGGDLEGVPVRCVHQDLGLVDSLSVMDNVALADGFRRTRYGMVSWGAQERRAEDLLRRMQCEDIDVRMPAGKLSPIDRSKVAIARVLGSWSNRTGLLILDEPTASLGDEEVTQLFEVLHGVRAAGHAVLYVTHRLSEVFELADRVTVLRQAKVVHTSPASSLDRPTLVRHMLGHELVNEQRGAGRTGTSERRQRLAARGLSVGVVRGLSFAVGEGEILGFAGLAGSGHDEIPPALVGASPADGLLTVGSETIPLKQMTPLRAHRAGLAYVPPDRKRQGIIAGWAVRDNTTVSIIDSFRRLRFLVDDPEMTSASESWAERVDLQPRDPMKLIQTLSGGNQQKVIVARCLATEPQVLVLSDPTAGVDVGAREQIWGLVRGAAAAGVAVVVASADTADLAAMCDRVLVMRQGVVYSELAGADITDSRISHEVLASHS